MAANSLYAAHLVLLNLKKEAAALTRQDDDATAHNQPTPKTQATPILPARRPRRNLEGQQ